MGGVNSGNFQCRKFSHCQFIGAERSFSKRAGSSSQNTEVQIDICECLPSVSFESQFRLIRRGIALSRNSHDGGCKPEGGS